MAYAAIDPKSIDTISVVKQTMNELSIAVPRCPFVHANV